MLRKTLLLCGAFASLLYVGIDVLAAIEHGEYHSFTSQVISELMARGAPTELLVDPLFLLYDALMVAFGAGVWMASTRARGRLTGALLVVYGALGLLGPTLFEMNLRGTADARADLPHVVLTGVLVLFILGAVAAGASLRGPRFRRYSFITLGIMVAAGTLTGLAARSLAAGGPAPWIGVLERLDIGAFLAWVAVLAIALWRAQRGERRSACASDPAHATA